MCLICTLYEKTSENVRKLEASASIPPWYVEVRNVNEMLAILDTDRRTEIYCHLTNKFFLLTKEDKQMIKENGKAFIIGGVDSTTEIWSMHWMKGFVPKFSFQNT